MFVGFTYRTGLPSWTGPDIFFQPNLIQTLSVSPTHPLPPHMLASLAPPGRHPTRPTVGCPLPATLTSSQPPVLQRPVRAGATPSSPSAAVAASHAFSPTCRPVSSHRRRSGLLPSRPVVQVLAGTVSAASSTRSLRPSRRQAASRRSPGPHPPPSAWHICDLLNSYPFALCLHLVPIVPFSIPIEYSQFSSVSISIFVSQD